MINLIELECLEFIDDAKPFILATYYEPMNEDVTELQISARQMYNTLVKMGELNMEFEVDSIIQQVPLPFKAFEQYINEMDFNMQQRVLTDYLLFTKKKKRLN